MTVVRESSRPIDRSRWAGAAVAAVVVEDNGFRRASKAAEEASSDVQVEATRNQAVLRGWLYRDVHVRPRESVVSHLGYAQLPVSEELRSSSAAISGWRLVSGEIVHESRSLVLAGHDGGFSYAEGRVDLPRLRCGTAPGWLTVSGGNGAVSPRSHRFYLPGVDLARLDGLVRALDAIPRPLPWSLKSSIGIDRDGAEVSRADRTVVYLDLPGSAPTEALRTFFDALEASAPAADGPGFSVELRPGVFFGGSGNDHGSFGTRIAGIAADALLADDFSRLARAEALLQEEADRLGTGGP